ncbi:hypothetical protein K443DRAFT_368038 [Laccaria amethystina LaAM-08-1]|uniref:Sensor domain-containing protein n=1 Tax=Laccaria amethystina LaAM-08-1 TaxID=1095629 RepID=A0A0C9XU62_9AGAR|nr:hypothetical protein K443DRAFT_368038 [Laccaria amethystina LaAM-08-1]
MVDDILDVPDAPSDSPPALTASDNRDNVITDPPPPYPLPRRQRTGRSRRGRLRTQHLLHGQMASADSYSDPDTLTSAQSNARTFEDDEEVHATETTPFLSLSDSPTSTSHQVGGRPRSYSHGSTMSAAPSLARTVLSLFVTEDGSPFGDEVHLSSVSHPDGHVVSEHTRRDNGFSWKAYFRPVRRAVYWRSLLHLALLNFPFALAAWVYLFVFTVTGTTLLMALPLGAVLCFFNLLGARAFARAELALQIRFHTPLSHPPPYPPRPIFTRYRDPTISEIESGRLATTRGGLIRETSFYKNTYAMFTDPTSYQALFYFIVIKPAITLLLSLGIIIFVLPSMILILPAPAALRAVRRLGIWQANVAIEGLYLAVR